MGPLFSRFRRKQTTVELLEQIDKEIKRLLRNRKVNQDRQKQFVTRLLIYSIAAYVIAAVIFVCICFPETWNLRLLYSVPLLIFPFLVWAAKRSLHWYFVQRISSNDAALEELRDTRNQILEDVMETETYKKAREILEKFDPARLHQLEGVPETAAYSLPGPDKSVPPGLGTAGTVIQRRTLQAAEPFPVRTQASFATSQEQNGAPHLSSQTQAVYPAQPVAGAQFAQPPRPPMPRSVLPRERGVMDKMMDYLVGDGPENRYALICQQCYSHNGMALKEEFEYLSFRCCYCYCINPARKQRPTAPRLHFFAPPGMRPADDADTSASDEESGDDDDNQNASHQIPRETDSLETLPGGDGLPGEKLQQIITPISHLSDEQEYDTLEMQQSDKQEPETTEIQPSDKQVTDAAEIQHSDKQEHDTAEIWHSDRQEHETPEVWHSDRQEHETSEIQHSDKQEHNTAEIQHSDKQEHETPEIHHSDKQEHDTLEIQHSDKQEANCCPEIQHSDR